LPAADESGVRCRIMRAIGTARAYVAHCDLRTGECHRSQREPAEESAGPQALVPEAPESRNAIGPGRLRRSDRHGSTVAPGTRNGGPEVGKQIEPEAQPWKKTSFVAYAIANEPKAFGAIHLAKARRIQMQKKAKYFFGPK